MNKLSISTASIAKTVDSDFDSGLEPKELPANFLKDISDHHSISDPKTVAGQKLGAVLAVKRTPTLGSHEQSPEVGDLLVILKSYNHYCDVFNIRNENTQTVPWEIFFPLTIGEKCSCPGGDCRCDVEDPDSFYAYRLALAGIGTFPAGTAPPMLTNSEPRTASRKAVHPTSLEGQTVGAIMIVQHKPHQVEGELLVEVNDYIEFLAGYPNQPWIIEARNLRSGGTGKLLWTSLFPVEERETCRCYWEEPAAVCRCKYVDFEKSRAFAGQRDK